MAESAVSFLLDQLSTLLREEKQLLGGLEREVQFIRDEMGQMNEFLRVADQSNPNQKEWIGQLREIAYDVEDVLDKYMLRFGPHRGANLFKKAYPSLKNFKARRQIAAQIQAMKYRLQNVSASQQRYRDLYANMDQGSNSAFPCYDGRGDALFLDDDEVVGIEKPKQQILEWIHSMDDGLEVISVVGMGGLGKTTLIKKVYDSESVKRKFVHHVWIIASEYNDVKHMLTSLIKKLVSETNELPPQELDCMSDGDMREFIFNFLKEKNYIIVLDDVWDISKWNAIRAALPKRDTHGCVVITTRSHSIANDACSETNHVHELKPLPENESRELFHKKAFPRSPCPNYLREYAEKILKKCQGLPLALSVIGGLLATKDNRAEEWEMFEWSLGRELKGGGSLEKLWKSFISLSYNDLPYYLKYCYLYLSIFPEDSLMNRETIIRLWMAEGFVQSEQDIAMEEVAVYYLNDLFNRSLIQVAKRDADGRVRAFRIHDLLRDYIVSKSGEDNIVTIFNGGERQHPSRVTRLAIQKSFNFSQDTYNLEFLRSLVLLCSQDMELAVITELVRRCRLLKVLELRGAPLETIPNEIFKLYYLKHLSLRGSMVKVIPKSIKYLVNLETLDLKNCNVVELPKEILELHRLRHLIVYSDSMGSVKAPCDIGRNLSLLTKLICIEANESEGLKMVREIGKLTELRRLDIAKVRSEDGEELCSSIAKLTKLRSLVIRSLKNDEKLELDYRVSLPFLRKLVLSGWIERVPEWIRSLNGLTRLYLAWSRLSDDPLKSLEDLPNLVQLSIHGAYFEGLRFKDQGFKKLKELNLYDLKCMKWVIVEAGSMPSLEKWVTKDCKLMRELPQGIEHLPHLQVLGFANMEDEFVEEKRNDWRLAHFPKVYFGKMTKGKWTSFFYL